MLRAPRRANAETRPRNTLPVVDAPQVELERRFDLVDGQAVLRVLVESAPPESTGGSLRWVARHSLDDRVARALGRPIITSRRSEQGSANVSASFELLSRRDAPPSKVRPPAD